MSNESHKIVIEACSYEVVPAGTDRYAVSDEFGAAMGYFEIRGKTVVPDDYGTGAHSVLQVGKAFRDHLDAKPKVRKACRQVCEIVSFEQVAEADLPKIDLYRKWLKSQPGLKAAFFLRDAESGKGRSVRVWSSKERMAACQALTPPAGAAEPTPSGSEVTPLIEDV